MRRFIPLLVAFVLLFIANNACCSTLFRTDPLEYHTNYVDYTQGCKVVAHSELYPESDPRYLTGWEEKGEKYGKRSLIFADKNQREFFVIDLGQVRPAGKIVVSTGLNDIPRIPAKVDIYGSVISADGPWTTLVEGGDPSCKFVYLLDNPHVRWLRVELGENTDGIGSRVSGAFGVYKRWKLPETAELMKAFYPKLRRDWPGLEEFWKKIDAKDWNGAASVLRTYEEKRYLKMSGMIPEYWVDAKLALENKFSFGGVVSEFRQGPDWTFEPPGALNDGERGGPQSHVARAYSETGDVRYAKVLVLWLETWLEQLPRPPETISAKYHMWATLGVAGRNGHWDQILSIIVKDRQNFSDKLFLNLMYSSWEQYDYLYHAGTEEGNWLAAVSGSVLGGGLNWPEYVDSKNWIEFAKKNFVINVMRDVYPDGKEFENSDGYVEFAYGLMLGNYRQLKATGVEIPPDVEYRIKHGTDWLTWMLMPNGWTFMIGDSNGGTGIGPGLAKEFDRPDLVYMTTRGKEGIKPSTSSIHFPISGWFSMRSDWEERPWEQARQLVMEAAPYGPHGGHSQLGIYCYAYGRPLLWVPCRFNDSTYGSPELWETVYTWSKNTVVVDGKTQEVSANSAVNRKCKNVAWFSGENIDLADATHGIYPQVNHRRRVLFLRGDYWVVIDDMTLKEDADPNKAHTYDQHFHFKEGTDAILMKNGAVRTAYKNGANLMLVPLEPEKLAASEKTSTPVNYIGMQAPTMYGWKYRLEGKGSKQFVTVMYPYPNSKVPKVTVKKLDSAPGAVAMEVNTPSGRDVIYLGDSVMDCPYSKLLKAKAKAFVARLDANGKPMKVSALEVESLKAGSYSLKDSKPRKSVEVDLTKGAP